MWQWFRKLLGGSNSCINDQGPSTLTPFTDGRAGSKELSGGLCTPQRASSKVKASLPDQDTPDTADATPKPRYIYSDGKPVGIANTVRKYQEKAPVTAHQTPFEARVEAKIVEEQVAAAAASGASQVDCTKARTGPAACDGGDTAKQLFAAPDQG